MENSPQRVLILDDEEVVRKVMTMMLERAGLSVASVVEGSLAVKSWAEAREGGTPFQLGIFDLTIPNGMGGREAAAQILAADPGARILVTSGYSNDPIVSEYASHGFCGVIVKPFRMDELLKVVKSFV